MIHWCHQDELDKITQKKPCCATPQPHTLSMPLRQGVDLKVKATNGVFSINV